MTWLLLLVPLALVAAIWWRRRRHDARQRELMHLCERAGLGFAPLDLQGDTAWLPFSMFGLAVCGTENVVWDPREGDDTYAFDYWYEDDAEQPTTWARRRLTCAVVPLPSTCPRLRVLPRSLSAGTTMAPIGSEVRLELETFDRRFRVESEDPRFAVAFLDQRMMQAVLSLPDGVVADVNEDVLLLWGPMMPAGEVLLLLDTASRLRRAVPRVVSSLFPPRPQESAFEDRWLQGGWSPAPTGTDAVARAMSPSFSGLGGNASGRLTRRG
ncbi:MAG TPA: hypothetical protein VFT27_03810 [Actinomycetota bacterium]|nr:hypothetical protein [Actinomycetota bacterium]